MLQKRGFEPGFVCTDPTEHIWSPMCARDAPRHDSNLLPTVTPHKWTSGVTLGRKSRDHCLDTTVENGYDRN